MQSLQGQESPHYILEHISDRLTFPTRGRNLLNFFWLSWDAANCISFRLKSLFITKPFLVIERILKMVQIVVLHYSPSLSLSS